MEMVDLLATDFQQSQNINAKKKAQLACVAQLNGGWLTDACSHRTTAEVAVTRVTSTFWGLAGKREGRWNSGGSLQCQNTRWQDRQAKQIWNV